MPSNLQHVDTDRNPYFRYEGIQRLANLTTTRSNVFAVWITVGFFECQKVQVNDNNRAAYKDGYKLIQELGSDAGDVRRHRAFYIIDRTVPVGFQHGKTHNAKQAVVLERFIE